MAVQSAHHADRDRQLLTQSRSAVSDGLFSGIIGCPVRAVLWRMVPEVNRVTERRVIDFVSEDEPLEHCSGLILVGPERGGIESVPAAVVGEHRR